MKKIIALTLTGLLALGGSGVAGIANASVGTAPDVQTEISAEQTAQNNLYLVPGTYKSEGVKIENAVGDGAEKLTEEQCGAIYTENAYLCTLSAGDTLPAPASEREGYTFNGWWTIVDATVTYFDKVPDISETTFLYADWRADLSQRKDPIEPSESTTVLPLHYMTIQRAATGETETLTLRVSGTDVINADKLLYDRAVQLYNGWFELNPGDTITVFSAGLGGSAEVQTAPLAYAGQGITLESSGDGSNVTGSYLTLNTSEPTLTYRKVQKTRHFRIYIKFSSAGTKMSVYMEPMD